MLLKSVFALVLSSGLKVSASSIEEAGEISPMLRGGARELSDTCDWKVKVDGSAPLGSGAVPLDVEVKLTGNTIAVETIQMGTSSALYSSAWMTQQPCSWETFTIKPASNGTEIKVTSVHLYEKYAGTAEYPVHFEDCFATSDADSCAELNPGGSDTCRDISLIYTTDSATFSDADDSVSCMAQTCPYQVNFKSQSHSGDSEIEAVLTTELGTTYSKVFTVDTTYGDKIIDLPEVPCQVQWENIEFTQKSDGPYVDLRYFSLLEDSLLGAGSTVIHGDGCFSSTGTCADLEGTSVDECDSSSTGGIKLANLDDSTNFLLHPKTKLASPLFTRSCSVLYRALRLPRYS